MILQFPSASWIAVGWRPANVDKNCGKRILTNLGVKVANWNGTSEPVAEPVPVPQSEAVTVLELQQTTQATFGETGWQNIVNIVVIIFEMIQ